MVAIALAVTARAEALKLGDKAPMATTKMKNVDGKEVSVADVAGKGGTLVIFTCNHCPFVIAWEGRIAEIGNAFLKKGVGVIAINPNNPSEKPEDGYEQMQARAKKLGLEFPYVVDTTSEVARAFGASRTPEIFLFDADGKLVYHGAVDDNKDAKSVDKRYLQDALDALLAGKPIPVAETKAVGCTIKWRGKA
jgi:peroxiredoxin